MKTISIKTYVVTSLFLGIFFISQFGCARGGGTSANSSTNALKGFSYKDVQNTTIQYRVIPFTSFYESQGLPPDLLVTFSLNCNQNLIKVIRTDIDQTGSLKDTILIGALVSENSSLDCIGTNEITKIVGKTFSGREFEVKPIY